MKKVGILVGREQTFPQALIDRINERGHGSSNTTAEFIEVGGVHHDDGKRYDLIIDRISHEVPFYRGFLKRAVLDNTIVINNPFWWSADDKFFNYSLAAKLGVSVPRTVLLPQKSYMEGVTDESLRNLQYPIDWQGIIDYVGLPAILKPFNGGGWKNVSRINSMDELIHTYDQTGQLCMTLQEFIDFDQFVRCYCIGGEQVLIMPYDPRKAYLSGEQYREDANYLTTELAERVTRDVRTLNDALGYDINTVEFAIRDGVPYAIDFMNPAPDADLHSVGEFNHRWVTEAVTDLVFKRLAEPQRASATYRWDKLLNPETTAAAAAARPVEAIASLAEQAARTVVPAPVRELGSDIVAGVSDFVGQAATAVTDFVDNATQPSPADSSTDKSAKKASGSTRRSSTPRKPSTPRSKKPVTEA